MSKGIERQTSTSESVGVSVEALSILGLDIASDPLLPEVLQDDFTQLVEGQPRVGEPFVHIPIENDYQLRKMLDIIDEEIYSGKNYPSFSVWHKTQWTHGATAISHLHIDIGRQKKYQADISNLSGQSRLALCDGDNVMFPYVHFVNMPHDKINIKDDDSEKDKETQIDSFNISREQYEQKNPDFDMFSFDVATYAMLTLHRRIRNDIRPVPLGTIIIPELGRKKIIGGSALAIVHTSATGQIGLGWSRGERSPATGIGISIGCNK